MAPARTPGPLGIGGTQDVKDGTLQIHSAPRHASVGAVPSAAKFAPVVLCEKGHTDLKPNWVANDGDTASEDPDIYKTLKGEAKDRVDKIKGMTDDELKKIFRNFLTGTLSTGELGGSMVDRFYLGKQDVMKHATGSALSQMARHSSSLKDHADKVHAKIGALLPKSAGPGLTNYAFLHNKVDVPTVNFGTTFYAVTSLVTFSKGDELTLKALIGGTQGLRMTLQNITYSKLQLFGPPRFAVDLRYEIFDVFGAGTTDIYTGDKAKQDFANALVAFWILQHLRKGHKPFINQLEVDIQSNGSMW